MKKYNKEILTSRVIYFDGDALEAVVLKDGEYYNIHVLSPFFNDDELNTLDYQQPIEYGVPSQLDLLSALYRHAIWYKHDVDVDLTLTHTEDI